ncbi:TlpA family protein disulfide reductase [Micromonospora sp. CA-263727]|uniref:TlpA family protein disulfide reductase n=1 Tax=Micromonospora sp. CA-263727 TaxID=3239967 RepID=UPI003D90099B
MRRPARHPDRGRGHVSRWLSVPLVVALALGGCSDADAEPPAVVPGGAAALPGPAPTGLALRDPPASAPTAPKFTATLTDGSSLEVARLWADRPVVLVFFASWCATCAERQDALSDLAGAYRDRVVFVGVASDDKPAALVDFLRAHRVDYPVATDPAMEVWRAYAMREPPGVVLVSRGGRLLRGWPGGVDAATLDSSLKTLVLAP